MPLAVISHGPQAQCGRVAPGAPALMLRPGLSQALSGLKRRGCARRFGLPRLPPPNEARACDCRGIACARDCRSEGEASLAHATAEARAKLRLRTQLPKRERSIALAHAIVKLRAKYRPPTQLAKRNAACTRDLQREASLAHATVKSNCRLHTRLPKRGRTTARARNCQNEGEPPLAHSLAKASRCLRAQLSK